MGCVVICGLVISDPFYYHVLNDRVNLLLCQGQDCDVPVIYPTMRIMIKPLPDISEMQTLDLTIGPLLYRFMAHDDWGQQILQQITRHVTSERSVQTPDRIIHLLQTNSTAPLEKLEKTLAIALAEFEWQQLESQLDAIWVSPRTRQTFWTATFVDSQFTFRFHLPWGLIIHDIIARGGGLIHGGLASFQNSGFLFLAPPGGGKSTALSTAPSNWQVCSDDAALVWPEGDGRWYASPLPAWGNMIRPDEKWQYPDLNLGQSCRLKGQILIHKGDKIELSPLSAREVVPVSYRALSEYPAAVMAETGNKEALFRMAAQISRDLTGWRLSLPRHADIWPLLVEVAA